MEPTPEMIEPVTPVNPVTAVTPLETKEAAPEVPVIISNAVPDAAPDATPLVLASVVLRMVPERIDAPLYPTPSGPFADRYGSPFHRVHPRPGALVSLTATGTQTLRVRLRVRFVPPEKNSGTLLGRSAWVRWSYALRSAGVLPETVGGEAVSAQDTLVNHDTELVLVLLPGERREANLEFVCVLDGDTFPGDYPFDIVASVSSKNGEPDKEVTLAGTFSLRHPPAHYLDELPSLYRDALRQEHQSLLGGGAEYEEPPFFERFLRGFEDAFQPMQDTLNNLHLLLSADTAPAEFLPWLAGWVSLALDENWPELRRRRLIKEAVALYRWRGTRRGLKRYLEIYTGVVPQIDDQPFAGMRLGTPGAVLGGTQMMLGHVAPHTFVVTLAVPDTSEVNEQIVRDIVEIEKPAHTAYELRLVRRRDTEPMQTVSGQDAGADAAQDTETAETE